MFEIKKKYFYYLIMTFICFIIPKVQKIKEKKIE